MHKITKSDVAHGMVVTERTITRYQNDRFNPLPVTSHGRGKPVEYDLREYLEWYKRHVLRAKFGDGKTLYSYEVEKARLTYHRASKAAL